MNKQFCMNKLSDLQSSLNWAQGKINMVRHDIEKDSSGGVCNEISEVIMSLEMALRAAEVIQVAAKMK